MKVRIRRAEPSDADFVLGLLTHEDVEPYMSVRRATDRQGLLEQIERSRSEPAETGRFVIEAAEDALWKPAGTMGFDVANRRSRIAALGGLAIHPDFRGLGLADEAARLLQRHLLFDLGFHRLELECYGFNERAIRHAERAGFVREGVKRKAYRRQGKWVDGILFGLLKEDFGQTPTGAEHPAADDIRPA
jgi:[ribosomal protein S5]-alanine N-acetyltransferase